jgi:hypothetical protein
MMPWPILGALAALAAAAGALGAPSAPRLPAAAAARYRVELAGEHLGWATLSVRCERDACDAVWESRLRLPEAGGATAGRRIVARVAPDGEAREVRLDLLADGRPRRTRRGAPGPAPAVVAEILLSRAGEGERRCVRVRDEEDGRVGEACARRSGAWLEGEVLGEPIRFRAGDGEAPAEVVLPAQRARFVADPGAALPARPPRVFGAKAGLTPGARRVCGRPSDPAPPQAPPELPRVRPAGASCRERSARYADEAARAGLRARYAVGIAFDGRAFVWHQWVEVQAGGAWIPVDPSFEQFPAAGPRFTLARFEEGDWASRAEAGRRLLACWGAGAGEPRSP